MTKTEILQGALTDRTREVLEYQINIDNYRLAMARIDAMPEAERLELADFRAQLAELHRTSVLEQKKSQIILDVIEGQLQP